VATAPAHARGHTRSALGTWDCKADTVETAELLVSELVTNAVKFSVTPATQARCATPEGVLYVALELGYEDGRLTIDVSDWNTAAMLPLNPRPHAEGGRGLLLARALSTELCFFCPLSGGKVVRCVIEE
jgi:anti-sigma regulatory factor (Ser/Thr protein kinase)